MDNMITAVPIGVPGNLFRPMSVRRRKSAGWISLLCLFSMVALSASSARATIVNGEFVGLDPGNDFIPGWSNLGPAPLFRGPEVNFAPFGDEVVYMATPEDFTGPPSAASVSAIEAHLSLAPGSISGLGHSPVNGSVIAQTFTANPGDVLSFEYNHLSFDDFFVFQPELMINDFSFVYLSGPGSSILQIIGDTSTLTGIPDNLEGIPAESGLLTFTSPPLLGGTYTLGIGVLNSQFSFGSSALLVDNVTLTAIPEARAWLGLGMVAAAVIALNLAKVLRAKKRRQATAIC